jgi:chromosome segregation ATPase
MTTPARDSLASHIAKVTQLRAASDEAKQPIADTSNKIDAAKAELSAAELAHDAALRREGELFVSGQDATAATAEVNSRAADLDRLRRLLAALVAQRQEQENTLRDKQTTVSIAESGFDILIANVVAEVGDAVMAELIDAATKLSLAQAKAKSLAASLVDKRWLAAAERINVALNTMKVPAWQASPTPKWREWISALESDANAIPVQP